MLTCLLHSDSHVDKLCVKNSDLNSCVEGLKQELFISELPIVRFCCCVCSISKTFNNVQVIFSTSLYI